jgi:hypothetical protein
MLSLKFSDWKVFSVFIFLMRATFSEQPILHHLTAPNTLNEMYKLFITQFCPADNSSISVSFVQCFSQHSVLTQPQLVSLQPMILRQAASTTSATTAPPPRPPLLPPPPWPQPSTSRPTLASLLTVVRKIKLISYILKNNNITQQKSTEFTCDPVTEDAWISVNFDRDIKCQEGTQCKPQIFSHISILAIMRYQINFLCHINASPLTSDVLRNWLVLLR